MYAWKKMINVAAASMRSKCSRSSGACAPTASWTKSILRSD